MNQQTIIKIAKKWSSFCVLFFLLLNLISCARMGQPDGGWYDETPPRILASSPSDRSSNVNSKKITLLFNEFITAQDGYDSSP